MDTTSGYNLEFCGGVPAGEDGGRVTIKEQSPGMEEIPTEKSREKTQLRKREDLDVVGTEGTPRQLGFREDAPRYKEKWQTQLRWLS